MIIVGTAVFFSCERPDVEPDDEFIITEFPIDGPFCIVFMIKMIWIRFLRVTNTPFLNWTFLSNRCFCFGVTVLGKCIIKKYHS